MARKHEGEPGEYVWTTSPVLADAEQVTLAKPDDTVVSTASGRAYRVSVRVNGLTEAVTITNNATRQVPMKKWKLVGPGGKVCMHDMLLMSWFAQH